MDKLAKKQYEIKIAKRPNMNNMHQYVKSIQYGFLFNM